MKRILIFALVSLLSLTAFAHGKQPTQFKKLPKQVQTVVKKNYTQEEIQFITCERVSLKKYEYQLVMKDGTSLEYNNTGELLKAKNPQGVKEVFVPKEIAKYVTKNFPNAIITRYKRETARQSATLNDSMELIFTRSGKFIRIDD